MFCIVTFYSQYKVLSSSKSASWLLLTKFTTDSPFHAKVMKLDIVHCIQSSLPHSIIHGYTNLPLLIPRLPAIQGEIVSFSPAARVSNEIVDRYKGPGVLAASLDISDELPVPSKRQLRYVRQDNVRFTVHGT